MGNAPLWEILVKSKFNIFCKNELLIIHAIEIDDKKLNYILSIVVKQVACCQCLILFKNRNFGGTFHSAFRKTPNISNPGFIRLRNI